MRPPTGTASGWTAARATCRAANTAGVGRPAGRSFRTSCDLSSGTAFETRHDWRVRPWVRAFLASIWAVAQLTFVTVGAQAVTQSAATTVPAQLSTATVGTEPTTPVSRLPLPYSLSVEGANGQATARLELPEQALPAELTGRITSNFDSPGTIKVIIAGRTAAQVDLRTGGPIRVPLTEADLTNGAVALTLAVKLVENADCSTGDKSTATLKDGLITYTHPNAPPNTIGTFLSAGLRSYTVVIPAQATDAEVQAGLDAVAALTDRYPSPTMVRLLAATTPPPHDYLNRVVSISTMPGATTTALTVTPDGRLIISGPPNGLAGGAVALADPNMAALQSRRATQVVASSEIQVLTGPVSLARLGNAAVSLSGVGRLSTILALNQPTFGRQIESFDIDLKGTLTPLAEGGQGRVDLLWNGSLLTSIPMTSSTLKIDSKLAIPAAQVQRENGLTVELSYVPPSGRCFPTELPARIDIDVKGSRVTANPGYALPPGFNRFPQEMSGTVRVALQADGPRTAQINQAGHLLAALQSSSSQQLVAQLGSPTTLQSNRGAGLLVGGDGQTATSMGAPVAGNDSTKIGPAGQRLTAVSDSYGALQAFETGELNVILLSGNAIAPEQQAVADERAGKLAVYADAAPLRWSKLQGQSVVLGASGKPLPIVLPEAAPPPEWNANPLVVAGIALGVLVLILVIWLWRRPKGEAPPLPGTE